MTCSTLSLGNDEPPTQAIEDTTLLPSLVALMGIVTEFVTPSGFFVRDLELNE